MGDEECVKGNPLIGYGYLFSKVLAPAPHLPRGLGCPHCPPTSDYHFVLYHQMGNYVIRTYVMMDAILIPHSNRTCE